MALVIKRTATFEYLGDTYKDCFLEFKSIPIVDLKQYQDIIEKAEADDADSTKPIIELLQKYFLNGKFLDENGQLSDVELKDLANLDSETAVKTFKKLTDVDENLGSGSKTTSAQ